MEFFKVNSKIELITENDDRIEGLIGDIFEDKIYFSLPADDKKFKLLRVGDKIKGLVYNKRKVIGFYGIVTNRVPNQIPTYELSKLSDFSVIQRRQNVRVECTLPIQYSYNKYLLNVDESGSNKNDQNIKANIMRYLNKGMMSDLSAGGLRFSCREDIKKSERILLLFNIEEDSIIVKGKVVYKEISPIDYKTIYIYGIQFYDLNEEKKEKIINHIFVLMRKKTMKK